VVVHDHDAHRDSWALSPFDRNGIPGNALRIASRETAMIEAEMRDPMEDETDTGTAALTPPAAANGEGIPAVDPVVLKEQVIEALREVHDPELGINIVDLGLVYGVELEGDTVHVTYTLTTMGCPIGPLIEAQIQQVVADIPAIEHVDAEMVIRPPWSPEMMSEEAKAALGFF
jgi:metal-sulfur cluster biosynthetic enzyme